MHAIPADTPASSDPSRAALDFVHRLLLRPAGDQPALTGLLAELTEAFGGTAGGLASLLGGGINLRHPERPGQDGLPPWQEDPSLLTAACQVPGAVAVERSSGILLLTCFSAEGHSQVLWLEGVSPEAPTQALAAALGLAGHALTRWLASESRPRWADQLDLAARQERLETAAEVTRRLAHDFGNVLTGILGFTELALTQQVPANTSLHSYLQEVYRAAQSGAQLTHQLRLFSRRQSATSRSSQLGALLAEQEARLFASQPTGLNFRLTVPADLPPVGLDVEHLHQVLTALLDNAREALAGPGSISVSARTVELTPSDCRDLYGAARPGPHVEIIIADTGIGLSPDVQRRLFVEPFFTTKPRRRGFGLAIAYGILHAHRGGLRLHPGEERGVVARLLLPVAPVLLSQPPVESMSRTMVHAPSGGPGRPVVRERVLVVDDDPKVLALVSTALEREGYRVDAFASAESALQAYFAYPGDPFRLVLTDVIMPGTGGVELARRLMARDPAVRLLFMSGHVSSEFSQPDFATQACEFLAKPFSPDQLTHAVRAALDRPGRRGRRETGPALLSGAPAK